MRCAVEPAREDGNVRRRVMRQRFVWHDGDSERRQPLLTTTLAPSGTGMEAVVTMPFGLLFESGLRLRVDGHEGTTLAFQTCLPEGCIARGALPADVVRRFGAGTVLHVEAQPAAGGDSFRLEGSLGGFAAASERLLKEAEER